MLEGLKRFIGIPKNPPETTGVETTNKKSVEKDSELDARLRQVRIQSEFSHRFRCAMSDHYNRMHKGY